MVLFGVGARVVVHMGSFFFSDVRADQKLVDAARCIVDSRMAGIAGQ